MVTEREVWLRQTTEDVIEPALPICDPHHHFMDRPGFRYMPEDLRRDIDGHRVIKTVFIDCGFMYRGDGPDELKPVGETEAVQAIAARGESGEYGETAIAAGIVGHADLTLGRAVEPVLEAQLAAGKGLFKGIRHSSAWDPSPEIPTYRRPPKGLLLDERFREGFSCLHKYGLSFDAWLYFHQVGELADLARAFPDTPIVLDHIGAPIHTGPYADKREEVLVEWKRGMISLAACSNTVVKLGGLGMPSFGFGWNERTAPPGSAELAEAMAPYLLWCIEQFEVGRCMFESNFPVDAVSYSYSVMWNAFKRLTAGSSAAERNALFHDTAVRFYRL